MKNTLIKQVIDLGFDFENFENETELSEISEKINEFLFENIDTLAEEEDECEVTSNGRGQHVRYGNYESDGEIVDFAAYWGEPAGTKIYHSEFVDFKKDGTAFKMKLYYLQPETHLNID